MKRFILLSLIMAAIPVIYLMGFKGQTFDEMLTELKLKRG